MKVKDLLNTCQNLWKGLFIRNKDFLIIIEHFNSKDKERLSVNDYMDFTLNGVESDENFKLIYKLQESIVEAWTMIDRFTIKILVK